MEDEVHNIGAPSASFVDKVLETGAPSASPKFDTELILATFDRAFYILISCTVLYQFGLVLGLLGSLSPVHLAAIR